MLPDVQPLLAPSMSLSRGEVHARIVQITTPSDYDAMPIFAGTGHDGLVSDAEATARLETLLVVPQGVGSVLDMSQQERADMLVRIIQECPEGCQERAMELVSPHARNLEPEQQVRFVWSLCRLVHSKIPGLCQAEARWCLGFIEQVDSRLHHQSIFKLIDGLDSVFGGSMDSFNRLLSLKCEPAFAIRRALANVAYRVNDYFAATTLLIDAMKGDHVALQVEMLKSLVKGGAHLVQGGANKLVITNRFPRGITKEQWEPIGRLILDTANGLSEKHGADMQRYLNKCLEAALRPKGRPPREQRPRPYLVKSPEGPSRP